MNPPPMFPIKPRSQRTAIMMAIQSNMRISLELIADEMLILRSSSYLPRPKARDNLTPAIGPFLAPRLRRKVHRRRRPRPSRNDHLGVPLMTRIVRFDLVGVTVPDLDNVTDRGTNVELSSLVRPDPVPGADPCHGKRLEDPAT